MLIKAVRKSVLVVGISLCVIPFFGSVYAQSNSNAAQLLLEMQAMRAEVADLRDMVERQQFEIKKLKQRNTELANAQAEADAKLATQIEQIQNARPVSAYPTRPLNQELPSNTSYDLYGGVSQQPQLQAQANLDGQSLEGQSLEGQSLEGQSLEGQNVAEGIATELDQPSSDLAQESLVNGSAQVAEQGALLDGNLATGPEIVERSFNSSDLKQPELNPAQIQEEGQQGVLQTSQEAGQIAEQATGGIQQTAEASGITIADQGTLIGSVANDGALPDAASGVPTSQTGSSPILSVPAAAGGQTASQTPINAAQVPLAPAVDSVAGSVTESITEAQASGQEKLVATNEAVQGTEAPEQGNSTVAEASTPSLSEDDYYDQGFEHLKQSKYEEAIDTFTQQVAAYPNGDLADDAHYWIAEAYFINRQPAQAKPHLRIIIDNYPTSPRLPDAMLKTAYIEQDTGNVIEARILLQEIVARHPSSNAAIAARNRLENLQANN